MEEATEKSGKLQDAKTVKQNLNIGPTSLSD